MVDPKNWRDRFCFDLLSWLEGMPPWALAQTHPRVHPLLAIIRPSHKNQSRLQETGPKVKPLLEQLDADSLAERDAAEKAILELGPEVIPLFPS